MNDSDLRALFGDTDIGPEPATAAGYVDDLLGRARRGQRRRRLSAMGMAFVAVALISALGAVGVTRRGLPDPGRVDWSPTGVSPAPSNHSRSGAMSIIHDITFPDAVHGYVVIFRCEPGAAQSCVLRLGETTDGGSTWSYRAMPVELASYIRDDYARMRVVGGTLIVDALQDGHKRWRSVDNGQSWQPVEMSTATVDAVPADGVAEYVEDYWGSGPGEPRSHVVVFTPDGAPRWLAAAVPGFDHSDRNIIRASDGSLWLAGSEGQPASSPVPVKPGGLGPTTVPGLAGGSLRPWLEVSRDGGRTWARITVPHVAQRCSLSTMDGVVLALSCIDDAGWTAYRSTDSGASWRRVASMSQLYQASENAVPLADGSVLLLAKGSLTAGDGTAVIGVVDGSNAGPLLYRVAPDGQITAVPNPPAVDQIGRVGSILGGLGGDKNDPHYFTSTDGLHWSALTFD